MPDKGGVMAALSALARAITIIFIFVIFLGGCELTDNADVAAQTVQ